MVERAGVEAKLGFKAPSIQPLVQMLLGRSEIVGAALPVDRADRMAVPGVSAGVAALHAACAMH
jgi:hypothetical protein